MALLMSVLWFAALATPLSTEVTVSPAVRAVVLKHRGGGPAAERDLEKLLAGGDRSAAVLLAELLMQPDRQGGPDLARACGYAEAAGAHPEALHNLANCYDNGLGRPRDKARARELYGKASDLGFAKAACALGNLLMSGEGGAVDVARGIDLCRRAADAGEPDAQTDYGGYLLVGRNVPRDAVQARRYLTLAAAARETGRPIPALILDEARGWMKIAAERDPDPANRRQAAELFSELAKLAPAD